jgi:rhodanese-related sulfurtransferase
MHRRRFTALAAPFTVAAFLLLSAAFASAGMTGCGGGGNSPTSVQISTFHEKMSADKKTIVLDVRTGEELSGELGKLDGVIHIPLQELDSRSAELDGVKDKDIYVVCRSGNRSGKATEMLRAKGFRAINVEGGMRAWRQKYGERNR